MFVRHESRIDISIWTSLQHFNGLVERASVCQNDADCRKSEANSLVTQSKAFFMLAGMEHHGKISFPSDGKNVMKLFAIWLPAFRNAVHLESANIRIEIEGQISAALQHGMANPQKWKRAFPLLWISHSMLERSRDLSLYLDADICGFKVHGVSERWEPNGKELHHVFSIARERNFPVMFHTGEHEECLALSYQRICLRFPTVRVILAHGRPLDQTIKMLQTCPNAYVDTAFMPHEHLKILLENRFEKRILFGTDTPIPGRYIQSSLPRHLRTRIATSQKICGKSWKQIGFQNAKELFR